MGESNRLPPWQEPAASRRECEERIKRWLGGQLRQRECRVPRSVWARLAADGYLGDILERDGSEKAYRGILRHARTFMADLRAGQRRTRALRRRRGAKTLPSVEEVSGELDLSKLLGPEEMKRADVLTRALARIAERHALPYASDWAPAGKPFVAEFRDTCLDGKVLSREEAEHFVHSIGVVIFEPGFFLEKGIPLINHLSALVTPYDWDSADSRHGLTPQSQVRFTWVGGECISTIGDRARLIDGSIGERLIHGQGRPEWCAVARGSVMNELMSLSALLSDLLPWTAAEAEWFILTGVVPTVLPLALNLPEQSSGVEHAVVRVELTLHPWVSVKSVQKVYNRIQRILVGPRNRPPEIRSLEFYDFVSQQRHSGATYADALRAWIKKHPSERRRYPQNNSSSVGRFTTQFKDVERQVLRPYGLPRRSAQENDQQSR